MHRRQFWAATALALASITGAHATTLEASTDGNWNVFDIADVIAADGGLGWIDITDGSALSFSFTVAAGQMGSLTVVDAGFAGDTFNLTLNGSALAPTSAAVSSFAANTTVFDFDEALANADYSRGVYALTAGSYTLTGSLASSVFDDLGSPLNSTVGAFKVDVSPVPLPATALLMLNGLGALALVMRRRAR